MSQERISQWVHQHGPVIRAYLLGMVGCANETDDLLQDVFHRAWEARYQYQENGTARAYLMRIADRLVCDRFRQRRSGSSVQLDLELWEQVEPYDASSEPPQILIHDEIHQQLQEALQELSPAQRRVLLLRFYGDLTFSQIAENVQWPLNTVLSHCRRGLLSLRKQLAEYTP